MHGRDYTAVHSLMERGWEVKLSITLSRRVEYEGTLALSGQMALLGKLGLDCVLRVL